MTNEKDNWWETEGEDWWEQLNDQVGAFGSGGGPIPSAPSDAGDLSIWGDAGSIGIAYLPSQEISLKSLLKSAKQFGKADELILMLRYSIHKSNVTSYVQKIEECLYGSETSTSIKDKNSLTKINQLYFHMLRAYTRAKEGNFIKATALWDEIGSSWLDVADEYRQPYMLSNLYVTSLCVADWDRAIDYLDRLWSLIKFMDANKRHAFGIWDEWISCIIVHWIFLKYCQNYREQFSIDFKKSNLFNCQKKILVLKHLNDSFISSVIDESYYNRARELNPNLPIVEYKEKPSADL